jgi:hypothetical protein
MHVWLAIEVEKHKRKLTSVEGAVKRLIPNRTHWYIAGLEIKSRRRARELHHEAEELLRINSDNPLAHMWMHNLEVLKECIDEGWHVNVNCADGDWVIKRRAGTPAARAGVAP